MRRVGSLLVVVPAVVLLAALAVSMLARLADAQLAARLVGAFIAAVVAIQVVERIPGALRGAPEPPDAFEEVWRRRGEPTRAPDPHERGRLHGTVRIAMSAAGDAHDRLRTILRELADARLDAVFGTHIDRDPRAAERLGPAAWAWVRPDRPQPGDRLARGPSAAELDAVVAGIERLGVADDEDDGQERHPMSDAHD